MLLFLYETEEFKMVEVKCRCGKSKRNFKVNVGYYIDECCVEAGYDDLGNLTKKPLDTTGLPSEEELAAAAETLQDDTSPEPEDPAAEETSDETESELSSDDLSKLKETKEEKKARKKAEKAAAMAAQRKAEKEAKAE